MTVVSMSLWKSPKRSQPRRRRHFWEREGGVERPAEEGESGADVRTRVLSRTSCLIPQRRSTATQRQPQFHGRPPGRGRGGPQGTLGRHGTSLDGAPANADLLSEGSILVIYFHRASIWTSISSSDLLFAVGGLRFSSQLPWPVEGFLR